MRILVASSGTIPGYSGGWTTTLDLLGDEHSPMYLISGARPGMHRMENVPYFGLGLGAQGSPGKMLPRRMTGLLKRYIEPAAVKWACRKFQADFILCLDEFIGTSVKKTGLPYAMRFHRKLEPSFAGPPLRKLLDSALFATATPGADVPGVEVIPHNQDLSRFDFSSPEEPKRALLLTCINDVHEPDLFLRGVCLSKHLKGDIIGTGPARRRIERECRKTGGRVRCLPPVPRLKVGELSGKYQIGVATIIRRDKVVYQMKINMYLACGMHTLVKPYTHIVKEAPHLVDTFSTPEELASGLDRIFREWRELEPRRGEAREWIMKNYSVEISRKRFRELLRENLDYRGGGRPSGCT